MKIALVQQYTADYQPLADLTIANHWEYCQRHGYDYCVSKQDIPYNPNFGFLRFPYLLHLFKEYNYDYIHFSGIDTLIMNYNIRIEDWIDDKYDFFVAKETSGGYRALNADVFIVKNSEKGRGLLEFVYSKQAEYSNVPWREQKVMIDYFDKQPYNEYVKIMPQQSFNSYPWRFYDVNQTGNADIHKGEPGDFKLGDFLLHAPGHTLNNRLRIWKEYLPQVIKGKIMDINLRKENQLMFNTFGVNYILQDLPNSNTLPHIYGECMKTVYGIENLTFQDNDIIIDIGANVGAFCIFAAKKFPNTRIFALEPSDDNFDMLLKNLRENNILNVIPLKLGISDKIEHETFGHWNFASACGGYVSDLPDDMKARLDKDVRITHSLCISLDSLFDILNIDKASFLKMDCEGGEFRAFESFKSWDKISKLGIEIHGEKRHELKESLSLKLKDRLHYTVLA